MIGSSFFLWLAWALFGIFLSWLVWKRYLPAVLQGTEPAAALKEPVTAPPAWLFCEDGTALDRKVQWFPLRKGGKTVIGSVPRSPTTDTTFVYLTADDIREDHVLITFNPENGRYEAEALAEGGVLHNNEPLSRGDRAELTDGDTLDLGRISRFRYTLTGPEAS